MVSLAPRLKSNGHQGLFVVGSQLGVFAQGRIRNLRQFRPFLRVQGAAEPKIDISGRLLSVRISWFKRRAKPPSTRSAMAVLAATGGLALGAG